MHFRKHQLVDSPHGNTVVWRYMSLDKFLDLLVRKRLFFVNAAKLTDAYEISIPNSAVEKKRQELKKQGRSGRDLEEELADFEWQHRPMRDLTLVNCWSKGRHESYALWKIYLSGGKAGIAIKTSIARIQKAMLHADDPYTEDVYTGNVAYRNHIPEGELSRFSLILTKREYYKFEEEVRFFIIHFPKSEGGTTPPYSLGVGRHVQVDLDQLIQKIYLSPFAGPWFRETLEEAIDAIQPGLIGRMVTSSIRDT